jgi:hypothetical protein
LDQEAAKHSHSQAAREFTAMAAGVRIGPGGRKIQPLTACRGIHSHGSWSQNWTRRQETTATHKLQGNLQPRQLESDLDQEAAKHSCSHPAGEFTAMTAGVRFGAGGRKTRPLTSCGGIHSHGSWSQIWTRRQENTATHVLQGMSQPWNQTWTRRQENTATHLLQGNSQP